MVSVDGLDVSNHRTEREAIESSLNLVRPGNSVRYRHEYLVIVQESIQNVGVLLSGQRILVNGD